MTTATKPPVKDHEHEWVQESVTMWTSPAKGAPIPGATVRWRCSRRSCDAVRVHEHKFRRPTRRQGPNQFTRDYDFMMPAPRSRADLSG